MSCFPHRLNRSYFSRVPKFKLGALRGFEVRNFSCGLAGLGLTRLRVVHVRTTRYINCHCLISLFLFLFSPEERIPQTISTHELL